MRVHAVHLFPFVPHQVLRATIRIVLVKRLSLCRPMIVIYFDSRIIEYLVTKQQDAPIPVDILTPEQRIILRTNPIDDSFLYEISTPGEFGHTSP